MVDPEMVADFFTDYVVKVKSLSWKINAHTSLVDVDTDLLIYSDVQISKLPFAFGTVHGDVDFRGMGLETLEGSPKKVRGLFTAAENNITSLSGGPDYVKGHYDIEKNPLRSLEGAPSHLGGCLLLTYSRHLPLLRLCMYEDAYIENTDQFPKTVRDIFTKYRNTGRPGALKAAAELIRAGYQENARW